MNIRQDQTATVAKHAYANYFGEISKLEESPKRDRWGRSVEEEPAAYVYVVGEWFIRDCVGFYETHTSSSVDRIARILDTSETILPTASAAETSEAIPSELHEVRRLTGASWEQIARLMGVQRRSIHHWMSGKEINRKNRERLGNLLATLRFIDRGNTEANRRLLHGKSAGGTTLFELLSREAFARVREMAGKDQGTPTRGWRKIDDQKAAAYAPETLGAMIKRASGFDGAEEDVAPSSESRLRRLKLRR